MNRNEGMDKVMDWAMHTLIPYARGGKVYNPSRFDAATVKEAATALEVVYDGYMPQKSDRYSLLNVVDSVSRNLYYQYLKDVKDILDSEDGDEDIVITEMKIACQQSYVDPYIEEAEQILDRTEKWKKDRQMIDMIIKCIHKYY